jgi:DeoD family purine-nucleoside phosphorylase
MAAPVHLQPTAELAPRALLPGDPGRALLLAQALLDQPRMFNHHRGLWGYTGEATDGAPLTIQSTGMGGPSAAIVVEELAELGVQRVLRIGTCGALAPQLALGELIAVTEVLACDGASRALGAGERLTGDPTLTAALAGDHAGPVVSTDLFYEPDRGREAQWAAEGALAVEMEYAAVFAVAARRGIPAGCVLAVSDLLTSSTHLRIEHDALREAEQRLGRVALAALA